MKKLLYLTALLALNGSTLFAAKVPAKHENKITRARAEENTKIKLTLGGKVYDLQGYNLSYSSDRVRNEKNRPAPGTVSPYFPLNSVSVTIRTSKVDQEFIDWMLATDPQPKEAQILIYDSDSKIIRTVTFTGILPGTYNESNNIAGYSNYNNNYTSFTLNYKTASVKM